MSDALQTHTPMAPTSELAEGERVIAHFTGDTATYWRAHAWMAAIAMALGMAILAALGNAHIWTGAIGGLAAIAVRAFYLASDEVKARWDLTNRRLLGPGTRSIPLEEIAVTRSLLGAVQVVTEGGDKHLLKYQADPAAVIAEIDRARGVATGPSS
ncbi:MULTISPECIES: hypothetical protein [Paracoccaceae]|jgi:hypothetical protein|uniref:hypothetical protein n=1 Tax=Rhodobacterales TaxID=204455 RepID=UPI001B04F3D8|nr:hypothetical protein [Boseongicola sp. H5]MBO6625253.1 hypothetical protein [Roseicyclus sp.]MBO6922536.1 hypothetical protein [Roseicyclus sp.]